MSRMLRVASAIAALTLFPCLVMPAEAQTLKLTVHVAGNTPGTVTIVSGGFGSCTVALATCTFDANAGATVRITAAGRGFGGISPGRFSGGTGPAAGCSLSTCSFAMTAAAELTATFTSGDGPVAVLGINPGIIADGLSCEFLPCFPRYLQGSSVHLDAAGLVGTGLPVVYVFTSYSGSSDLAAMCSVTSPVCDFTLTGSATVTANFTPLSSFAVTPGAATGFVGGPAQQFTAIGSFSGGSLPIAGQGSWSSRVNLPFNRTFLGAATLGGKIYALGGSPAVGTSAASDVAVYTPGDIARWDVVASMLAPRAFPAAVATGGALYAIGGYGNTGIATATIERYDPALNTWTFRAPMSSPRYGVVAGVANGVIYAAGGLDGSGAPVATLEAYNPVTDTWTTKAPMPAARGFVAGGVIDGILYVVGGTDGTSWSPTVQAYDPATNTWAEKSRMPAPLSGATSAVADSVLYVMLTAPGGSVLFAYDGVADAWMVKKPPPVRGSRVAAALDGAIYAIGGHDNGLVNSSVDFFVDTLRWSSSAPSVARIAETGAATPLAAGTATITANISITTCGSCSTFTVIAPPPTDLALDAPVNNTVATAGAGFTVGGWALNRAAVSGTGVDAIHVYAAPAGGGAAIFLGVAPYGGARADVAAIFGSQFTNSGFTLWGAGQALPAGTYTILAYAHNALTQQFDVVKSATIQLQAPVSQPFIAVDTPQPSQVVTSAFEIGGWALDSGAPTGSGVDAVHFYVFPNDGASPGVFMGSGSYGLSRPDVGAIFGSRFTDSGYHFTITGLGSGAYVLGVYARSTVTGSFSIVRTLRFTVSATALMSIDTPGAEATITTPTFGVSGWSIDRTVESTAQSGSGVDTLHVYAYPNPGSGQAPIFLGVATVGIARPDIGATFGSRYANAGYTLGIDRAALGLAPGVYNLVVHSHSTVTGSFNNVALVRVKL